jgi:uncharacterized protein (DUF1501 family)
MTLDRRDFLRLCAAGGLAAAAPAWLRHATATEGPAAGPYWLFVHAAGGWDPTLLCDPKGRATSDEPDPVNTYLTDDIEEVGPFRFAPISGHRAFFTRVRDDLLVLNGLDAQTNSHEVGTRHTWSGSMTPGTPALAALIAADADPRPSLSLLSHGGYDLSAGLVAPTRLASTGQILAMAYPDRLDEDDPESALFAPATLDRLRQARADRLDRQIAEATLPLRSDLLGKLRVARAGDDDLARLAEVLPASLDGSNNPLRRQAQVSMACFSAGVSVSATLEIGGFDTHADHDRAHTAAMQSLVDGLTFALDEAERQGVADRLIVVVGSDFARTPRYNEGRGKDHGSITSMMMMGPGIRGGRVIGSTDARQTPIGLDPVTLAPSAQGVRLTPGDVHASLRALAGLDGSPTAAPWPVGADRGLLG